MMGKAEVDFMMIGRGNQEGPTRNNQDALYTSVAVL